MIVLSGTHGTLAGESALSLQDERNVHQVGIISSLRPSISKMPYHSDKIPDILKIRKLMDEVPFSEVGQRNPDWLDCEVRENVIWLVGLSPGAPLVSSTKKPRSSNH